MDPLVISLVSAATALVASIAGPCVAIYVARSQFNERVLSANRQKWIETLRDMLAELISLMIAVVVVKRQWQGKWNLGMDAIAANPSLLAKVERLVVVQWTIRLLINPAETDHQRLYDTIDSALKRLQAEEMNESEVDADVESITRQSQTILKREWVRVKRGV